MKTARNRAIDTLTEGYRQQLAQQTGAYIAAMSPMIKVHFDELSKLICRWNEAQGFWSSENVGEKLMLMVSELAEAMEADRKDIQQSEHIPEFTGVEEELADVVIRILDFAFHFKLRLPEAIVAKTHFNLSRPYMHGKKN